MTKQGIAPFTGAQLMQLLFPRVDLAIVERVAGVLDGVAIRIVNRIINCLLSL